jgi:hypothetical protein
MGNIYLYATAFFGHWWPLVSAGSLLGFQEFVERYWAWGNQRYQKVIPAEKRGRIKVAALLLACLYSGYLAWSDEHTSLLEANDKLARKSVEVVNGAKMVFSRIEPEKQANALEIDGQKQDLYNFKIWFKNSGAMSAQSPSLRALPFLSDNILSSTDEDNYMKIATNRPNIDMKDNDAQPGTDVFYYTNTGYMGREWDRFTQQKEYLYIFSILSYPDEASRRRKICYHRNVHILFKKRPQYLEILHRWA